MKKCVLCFMAIVMTLVFTSCDSAQNCIDKLERLVKKVELKGDVFTQQEWDEVFVEYEELVTKMEQYSYDKLQLKEIGRLKARFGVACAEYGIKNMGDMFSGLLHQAVGAMDEIVNTVNDAVETMEDEGFLQEETEEVDEILNELENLFE